MRSTVHCPMQQTTEVSSALPMARVSITIGSSQTNADVSLCGIFAPYDASLNLNLRSHFATGSGAQSAIGFNYCTWWCKRGSHSCSNDVLWLGQDDHQQRYICTNIESSIDCRESTCGHLNAFNRLDYRQFNVRSFSIGRNRCGHLCQEQWLEC